MSLGQNIQFLRKRENITQEEFAEKMNVSRQTVSKWESDAAFPETDKILQICELFSCDMDTLMRGSVEETAVDDTEEYDRHHNRFTAAVACACAMILAGVTLLLVLNGFGVPSAFGAMLFMVFVVIAVTILIITGINHGSYIKKHPQIKPFYKHEVLERFDRRFPFLIALPTALILIGVIWTIGSNAILEPLDLSDDQLGMFVAAPLLFLITVSVPIYIYAGMQKSKYDIDAYNQEHAQNEEKLREDSKNGRWSSCIMLTATAVYLLMGFIGHQWQIGWVVFPIGGILCGIVSILLKKKE